MTGPDRTSPPSSQPWMFHAAMAATLAATLGLHLRLGVGVLQALLASLLVFALPIFSVAQLSMLRDETLDRPGVYAGSAITLGVLAAVALVVGALGPGLASMGMALGPPMEAGRVLLLLLGATALLMALFHGISVVARIPESSLLARLLPRTPHERRLFAGLSLMAGFGEEVVFRGFLLAVLTPALGDPWTALVASSLAFGVLHVYQGSFGIVRTAALGALLGVPVVLGGSLWPSIVVHACVDLVGGLVVGPRTIPPPREGA